VVIVKTGHGGRNAAIIILVLLFLFFFLPVIQYSSTSSSTSGASPTHVSGMGSLSAYLFSCGLVLNLRGTGYVFGVQVTQSAPVSGFFCNASAQHQA
jgi:hypothetical protein